MADPLRGASARRLALAAAALLAAATLTACDTGSAAETDGSPTATPGPSPEADQPRPVYVALGDSFTAAPYVPRTDLAAGCLRSNGNYPSLLAASLDAELVDVSCSGADTADVARRQEVAGGQGTVPPQIKAVRDDADLVTVGLGGNDRGLFGTLITGCTAVSDQPGSPCRDVLEATLGERSGVLGVIRRNVAATLRRVSAAAPDARVVLVGYPRLVSPSSTCPSLPLTPADRAWLVTMEAALDGALQDAAAAAGVEFLDVRTLSKGHEVCAKDPWVNGSTTDQAAALAFHPFAVEQQAVADALADLVGTP